MAPKVSAITLYPIKSCHYINVDSCEVDELGLRLDRRFMFIDELTGRFITQRKYASMTLIRPIVDTEKGTLTLTAQGLPNVSVPLFPDVSKLVERKAQLWKDTLTVFDMGDEAAEWITNFLKVNRKHDLENDHNPEEAVKADEFRPIRLVTLDDPNNGRYARPAHRKLPGIHSPFTDWSPISFGFEASLADLNKGLVEKANGRPIPINRFRNNLTISGTTAWEEDDWLVVQIGDVTFYVIRPIARCTVPSVDQDTGIKDDWGSILSYLKKERHFDEKPNDGFFCVDVAPLTRGTIHVGDEVKVLERVPKSK